MSRFTQARESAMSLTVEVAVNVEEIAVFGIPHFSRASVVMFQTNIDS